MEAERQAATVDLDFQISYWLQIAFRFISLSYALSYSNIGRKTCVDNIMS